MNGDNGHLQRLTDEQRARLAHDPDTALAAAVTPPPTPTPDEQRRQIHDPSLDVRAAAARHPDLPEELLQELLRRAGIPLG